MRKKKIWGGGTRFSQQILFLLGLLGIWGLTVFLYYRTLKVYFVGEDYEWWTRVRDLGWAGSLRLFLPPKLGGIVLPPYWRPLVGWTVWLDTVPLGMTPFAFHVTSLFFHLINIGLIGLIGFYLFKKDWLVAFMAGLFFATFPFHSEAVVWSVGGRADLVMTSFYLLGVLLVCLNLNPRGWHSPTSGVPSRPGLTLGVLLAFFLALLSKEAAVTLPLGMVLVAFLHTGRGHSPVPRWVRGTAPTSEVLLRSLRRSGKLGEIRRLGWLLLGLVLVFLVYFGLRSWAVGEINPYVLARHLEFSGLNRVFLGYLGVLGGVVVVCIFFPPHRERASAHSRCVLMLLFLLMGITLLPTAYMPTQERQLYLPSAVGAWFLAGLAVALLRWVKERPQVYRAICLGSLFLIIFLNGQWLWQRNENWRMAGGLAEEIASQLALALNRVSKDKKVYLINLPDSLNGAYVYRTHLKEAVELKMGEKPPLLVLTPTTIGVDSEVVIAGPRKLLLASRESFVLFRPTRDEQGRLMVKTSEYRATQLNPKALQVEFLADDFDFQKDLVYLFRRGEIREIRGIREWRGR